MSDALLVATAFVLAAIVSATVGRIEFLLRRLAPGCTCPRRGLSSTCPAHKEYTP